MIYVTTAPNDDDLAAELGSLAVRAPVPHGDAIFFGTWEDDQPIRVLVERKRLSDMIDSVLGGRYLAQAQKAIEAGFEVLVLIVETGIIRPGKDGLIEYLKLKERDGDGRLSWYWLTVIPNIAYSRFDTYLQELQHYTPIKVRTSVDVHETASQIKNLWQLYSRPPSAHNSLKQLWEPPHKIDFLKKPSLVRKVASQFPGIGWERSGAVDQKFGSVAEMVGAGVQDWESIDGIGRKTALTVTAAIQARSNR